jgi:antitoxin VapB
MIDLSHETEALAKRLAAAQNLSVEDTIRQALEERARAADIAAQSHTPHRMSVEEMLAVGAEIAAMPLLDQRTPRKIMDDINAP